MSDIKQIADRVAALEMRMAELEQARQGNTQSGAREIKALSVKEFILSKKPSGDVEKTLAIAYFLDRFAGSASFNVDDLSKHFQLAKESIPTNINDKVNKNVAKGYMAEAKEKKNKKKAWMVTNSGEKFVENNFSD